MPRLVHFLPGSSAVPRTVTSGLSWLFVESLAGGDETGESDDRPILCIAVDQFVRDRSPLSNAALAADFGVNESTFARWRRQIEPDQHVVLALEEFFDATPGTIYRMCDPPFVVDADSASAWQAIRNDTRLTEGQAFVLAASYEAAVLASERERSRWSRRKRN